jgi:hypothetical protein
VARQLLRLRNKIGRPINGTIEIGLSREELARMTGTTLFTVSRLLSAWEAQGIVKPRREAVRVRDAEALAMISEGGDSRSTDEVPEDSSEPSLASAAKPRVS